MRPLERDDPLAEDRLDFREQRLDTGRFVDDFDDDGQFLRDRPGCSSSTRAFRTQAEEAFEYRRALKPSMMGRLDNPLVQRRMPCRMKFDS